MKEGKELFRNEDCFASETCAYAPPKQTNKAAFDIA